MLFLQNEETIAGDFCRKDFHARVDVLTQLISHTFLGLHMHRAKRVVSWNEQAIVEFPLVSTGTIDDPFPRTGSKTEEIIRAKISPASFGFTIQPPLITSGTTSARAS
jgi:hypothetical protein